VFMSLCTILEAIGGQRRHDGIMECWNDGILEKAGGQPLPGCPIIPVFQFSSFPPTEHAGQKRPDARHPTIFIRLRRVGE
jgi:hypothetical protein